MEAIGRGQTDPNPWPIFEWTMANQAEINGAVVAVGPRSWAGPPMASHTSYWHAASGLSPVPALYGPCVPVYPPGHSAPVLSVTGDNFAFLVFLRCTHRACGSSPIPNPAALHLRGSQSSKISAARGGSKPAQLHHRFTNHTGLPSITNPPLLTTI